MQHVMSALHRANLHHGRYLCQRLCIDPRQKWDLVQVNGDSLCRSQSILFTRQGHALLLAGTGYIGLHHHLANLCKSRLWLPS